MDNKNGIRNLKTLLSAMDPALDNDAYIFHTIKREMSAEDLLTLNPIGMFREKEGISLIINKHTAEKNNIGFETVFRLISLHVHSSLNAVGLTAAIATKLASARISANIVAGYYHDHIFVQQQQAENALNAIKQLQAENKK